MATTDTDKVTLTKAELKQLIQEAKAEQPDLQTILETVIREIKKPTALEQKELDRQQREIESSNQERLDNSQSIIARLEQKRWEQSTCNHEHAQGQSHCVFILDGNYMLCQKNQCIIRPGTAPANYQGSDVYNTQLFNSIFQKLAVADIN
jgi:predicted RNase H-like nuclease (RuvC/YqgF family)